MKTTDLKILHHIRRNARENLTTISRKTGIPVSTIFDRLRSHEQQFVVKFTALVDFSKLGYPVRAYICLKVDPQDREGIKNYLCVHSGVNTLQRINNGFDYSAECLFTNIKEVEEFVESLEIRFKIIDKHVFHIIDDIVREKALTGE